jgi:hypothetical protein
VRAAWHRSGMYVRYTHIHNPITWLFRTVRRDVRRRVAPCSHGPHRWIVKQGPRHTGFVRPTYSSELQHPGTYPTVKPPAPEVLFLPVNDRTRASVNGNEIDKARYFRRASCGTISSIYEKTCHVGYNVSPTSLSFPAVRAAIRGTSLLSQSGCRPWWIHSTVGTSRTSPFLLTRLTRCPKQEGFQTFYFVYRDSTSSCCTNSNCPRLKKAVHCGCCRMVAISTDPSATLSKVFPTTQCTTQQPECTGGLCLE